MGMVGLEKGLELSGFLLPWKDSEYAPSPIVDHNDPKIRADVLVPKGIAVIEKTKVPTERHTGRWPMKGSPDGGGGASIDPAGAPVAKYLQIGVQVEELGIAYCGTVGQMQPISLGNAFEQLIENTEIREGNFFQIVFPAQLVTFFGLQPLLFIRAYR